MVRYRSKFEDKWEINLGWQKNRTDFEMETVNN